jgi:Flp pilus assembly protein TadG
MFARARDGRAAMRFLRDGRAGVALLFALSLLPILGLTGLAIDFGFATQARTALDMAADTAALSAVKIASNAASAGNTNAIALGRAAGLQWFTAQTVLLANATTAPPTIVVTQSGTSFTATVTYQASVSLFFGSLFGVRTATVSNTAVSTMTSNTYVNITFLLDNSGSMLLASTEAGITQLNALTLVFKGSVPDGLQGIQCAFACHWQTTPGQQDYYSIARTAKIQLRTDVLQLAFTTAVQSMLADAIVPNQFGIGVFTFDSALTQIYPVGTSQTTTTDIADAQAAVTNIPVPCCADVPNTYFPTIMTSFVALQTASGDGTTPATPKKVLIIVTDGVADYPPRSIPSSKGPLNPANCSAIKALGFAVYVLYTTYSSDPTALLNNAQLGTYLTGSPSAMDVALQSCASAPGNFQEAVDPATTVTALNQMLLSAIGTAGRFVQ